MLRSAELSYVPASVMDVTDVIWMGQTFPTIAASLGRLKACRSRVIRTRRNVIRVAAALDRLVAWWSFPSANVTGVSRRCETFPSGCRTRPLDGVVVVVGYVRWW